MSFTQEAASNERVRQVYRAVAAVHEGCGELVDIVRETGATQREISDLREQVKITVVLITCVIDGIPDKILATYER